MNVVDADLLELRRCSRLGESVKELLQDGLTVGLILRPLGKYTSLAKTQVRREAEGDTGQIGNAIEIPNCGPKISRRFRRVLGMLFLLSCK